MPHAESMGGFCDFFGGAAALKRRSLELSRAGDRQQLMPSLAAQWLGPEYCRPQAADSAGAPARITVGPMFGWLAVLGPSSQAPSAGRARHVFLGGGSFLDRRGTLGSAAAKRRKRTGHFTVHRGRAGTQFCQAKLKLAGCRTAEHPLHQQSILSLSPRRRSLLLLPPRIGWC